MKSHASRVLHAAIVGLVYAAIAASCNSSSPVESDSTIEAAAKDDWFVVSPVQVQLGSSASTATITLSTIFKSGHSWTASENAGWLSLGSKSGSLTMFSTETLSLSVQRSGLAAGEYSTQVTFQMEGAGTEVVPVTMQVASAGTASFAVTPLQLDFGSAATILSVTLKNNGGSSISWSSTKSAGWIGRDVGSGTIAAGGQKVVHITVSRSGKTAGSYSGNVTFTTGSGQSVTVAVAMTVPSGPSGVLLSGQLINQFTGSAMAGVTVQYAGKSATTNSSGAFTLLGSATSILQPLTLTGPGVYKRVTYARTGDNRWNVVPSGFNMSAFNDVARQEFGSSTTRWLVPPTVYVDSRPRGFSSSEMSTWTSQVKVQAADFVSKWSGTVIRPSAVIVTALPPPDFTPGTIVIHISDNSADFGGSSQTIGYARLWYSASRVIQSSVVWLRYPRYPGTANAGKRMGILGHELGHGMGLGHMTSGTVSLMEPSIGSKTDLKDFDHQIASLHYSRSPGNAAQDIDSSGGILGSLAPSAAPTLAEWVCEAGEEASP